MKLALLTLLALSASAKNEDELELDDLLDNLDEANLEDLQLDEQEETWGRRRRRWHGHWPHGHRPHGHRPHGHRPHRHRPHGHNPHVHCTKSCNNGGRCYDGIGGTCANGVNRNRCLASKPNQCASCNDGYYKSNHKCMGWAGVCKHGHDNSHHAGGALVTQSQRRRHDHCGSCANNFELHDYKCWFEGSCPNGSLKARAQRTQVNHCGSCNNGYYLDNEDKQCKAWRVCEAWQKETRSPTTTRNRECANYNDSCPGGTAIALQQRRQDNHCGTCDSTHYLQSRTCHLLTVCDETQYESVAPAFSSGYDCDQSKNFVNGASYSQIVLGNNQYPSTQGVAPQAALHHCEDECDNRAGCTGFFFQTHNNNIKHQICGFYSQTIDPSAMTGHGHFNGAVCLQNGAPSGTYTTNRQCEVHPCSDNANYPCDNRPRDPKDISASCQQPLHTFGAVEFAGGQIVQSESTGNCAVSNGDLKHTAQQAGASRCVWQSAPQAIAHPHGFEYAYVESAWLDEQGQMSDSDHVKLQIRGCTNGECTGPFVDTFYHSDDFSAGWYTESTATSVGRGPLLPEHNQVQIKVMVSNDGTPHRGYQDDDTLVVKQAEGRCCLNFVFFQWCYGCSYSYLDTEKNYHRNGRSLDKGHESHSHTIDSFKVYGAHSTGTGDCDDATMQQERGVCHRGSSGAAYTCGCVDPKAGAHFAPAPVDHQMSYVLKSKNDNNKELCTLAAGDVTVDITIPDTLVDLEASFPSFADGAEELLTAALAETYQVDPKLISVRLDPIYADARRLREIVGYRVVVTVVAQSSDDLGDIMDSSKQTDFADTVATNLQAPAVIAAAVAEIAASDGEPVSLTALTNLANTVDVAAITSDSSSVISEIDDPAATQFPTKAPTAYPTPYPTPRCEDHVSYYTEGSGCVACPDDCGLGTYRAGCGHDGPGECIACDQPVNNAHHTTNGDHGAANSCAMECNAGYHLKFQPTTSVAATYGGADCVLETPAPTNYPTPNPTAYPTPYPTPYPTTYPTPYPTPAPTPAPTATCPVTCQLEHDDTSYKNHAPVHPGPYQGGLEHADVTCSETGTSRSKCRKVKVTHNVYDINTKDTYKMHRCYRDGDQCLCECIDGDFENGLDFFDDNNEENKFQDGIAGKFNAGTATNPQWQAWNRAKSQIKQFDEATKTWTLKTQPVPMLQNEHGQSWADQSIHNGIGGAHYTATGEHDVTNPQLLTQQEDGYNAGDDNFDMVNFWTKRTPAEALAAANGSPTYHTGADQP